MYLPHEVMTVWLRRDKGESAYHSVHQATQLNNQRGEGDEEHKVKKCEDCVNINVAFQ